MAGLLTSSTTSQSRQTIGERTPHRRSPYGEPVTISSSPSGASGDVTLDSYDATASVYLEQSPPPGQPSWPTSMR